MDRAILHLDIPAFPIAVERVVAPRLVGRPVAVAPSSSTRAPILVSSLEARAAGVFRGMPLARAVRICRDLTILPPNPSLYRRASGAVLSLLSGYSPLLEPAGGGHVFLDMTGTQRLFGEAADSADRIHREVLRRLRLASTLGIASNKLVSRVAARVIRPERLYDVFPGSEAPFLAPLEVDLLPAVDPPSREVLSEVNVVRVKELAALSLPHLRILLGKRAWRLFREARGIDESPVRPPEAAPVVREEETLAEDSNEEAVHREALDRLAARAAAQLRGMAREAAQVAVRIRYADGVEAERSERPAPPTGSEFFLREAASRLFEKARRRRIRIRHLEVTLSDLREMPRQLLLFDALLDPVARRDRGNGGALERWNDAAPAQGNGGALARGNDGDRAPRAGTSGGIPSGAAEMRHRQDLETALARIRERYGMEAVGPKRLKGPEGEPGAKPPSPIRRPGAAGGNR
jgi:DNA polymerase IV